MNIQIARLKDAKEILELLKNTPELSGSAEEEIVYTEEFVKNSILDKKLNLFLVAKENNKIIGLLLAEIWKKKKYSYLIDIVVLDAYRTKGLGSKLYKHYEAICKNKVLKSICGIVKTDNTKMHKFCEKMGLKRGSTFYFYEKEL